MTKSEMVNLKSTRRGFSQRASRAATALVCFGLIALILAACDTTNPSLVPELPSPEPGTTLQPPSQPTRSAAGLKPSPALTQSAVGSKPSQGQTRSPAQTASSGSVSNWCDKFAAGQIDASKWQQPSDPSLIFAENGGLNFAVTEDQSSQQGVDASIQPVPANQDVKEISFAITLNSVSGNVPGGAGLEFFQADGRDSSMYIGPGGGNGPDLEISICRTTKCSGQEDEYDHPGGSDFPTGVRTPMRIVRTGGKIQFYVNGAVQAEYNQDPSPIRDFQFSLSSEKGSVFHIKVEDVCVSYGGS